MYTFKQQNNIKTKCKDENVFTKYIMRKQKQQITTEVYYFILLIYSLCDKNAKIDQLRNDDSLFLLKINR